MKKSIRAIALLLSVLLLSGCALFRETAAEIEKITLGSVGEGEEDPAVPSETAVSPAVTDAPSSEEPTESTTEESTEEPTEEATEESASETTEAPADGRVFQGTTDKGYSLYRKDGATYVETAYGDVIIANKTYALPSDYGPDGLTPECDAAYDRLKAGAAAEGLSIWIVSSYRSYWTQQSLYARYCAADGAAAADTYSARPGHSEHQTGLAIDVNSLSSSFADTPEGQWLAVHAHEYGFIIRYAKEKQDITGYVYEPWHIRYLGEELARDVYNSGLCLEEYFGITSVYAD